MTNRIFSRNRMLLPLALLLVLTSGCSAIRATATPPPAFWSLDSTRITTPTPSVATTTVPVLPTLLVNPPHASAGFDSQRIIYVRESHALEYFSHNEWVDTPARMLAPLIVTAVQAGGAYRAVVPTPSAAAGDLRLDVEIVRLQQDFGGVPSRVRFTLRTYIVDNLTREVLARREFDETVNASSDDPRGGVVAANRVVQVVLAQLALFCADTARNWSHPAANH